MRFTSPALPFDVATDAAFRQNAQWVHDTLIAAGFVQTTDTGQINLATVLRPGGAQTVAGYEIFRFNDGLQANRPLFLRVDYATSNFGTNTFTPRVQIGTSTNGAGALAGNVISAYSGTNATPVAAATHTMYAWSDGSAFWLADVEQAQRQALYVLGFERGRKADGSIDPDIVLMIRNGPGGSPNTTVIQTPTTTLSLAGPVPAGMPGQKAMGVDSSVLDAMVAHGSRRYFAGILWHGDANLAASGLELDIPHLGATKHWKAFSAGEIAGIGGLASDTLYPLLRWDP